MEDGGLIVHFNGLNSLVFLDNDLVNLEELNDGQRDREVQGSEFLKSKFF
jgi:hypothetical protein